MTSPPAAPCACETKVTLPVGTGARLAPGLAWRRAVRVLPHFASGESRHSHHILFLESVSPAPLDTVCSNTRPRAAVDTARTFGSSGQVDGDPEYHRSEELPRRIRTGEEGESTSAAATARAPRPSGRLPAGTSSPAHGPTDTEDVLTEKQDSGAIRVTAVDCSLQGCRDADDR